MLKAVIVHQMPSQELNHSIYLLNCLRRKSSDIDHGKKKKLLKTKKKTQIQKAIELVLFIH